MAKPTDPDPSKPLFTERKSFEAWLKDKPKDWAVDLAMRSALRVGVLLWPVRGQNAPSRSMASLLLQTHRVLFILHSTSGDNVQRKRAADAVNAIVRAARATRSDANAARAAAGAATYAADANAVIAAAYAADAAAYAANAAAYADADAGTVITANAANYASVWSELEQEARYFSLGTQRTALARLPLWRERSDWVDLRFETTRQTGLARSPFNFWLAWYRLVLLGESTHNVISPKAVQDLALADSDFWTPK